MDIALKSIGATLGVAALFCSSNLWTSPRNKLPTKTLRDVRRCESRMGVEFFIFSISTFIPTYLISHVHLLHANSPQSPDSLF